MKKLLLLGALAIASLTSNAANFKGYLDRSGWAVTVCSWINEGNGSGAATTMYDDDLNTYYHQNWSTDTGRGTHWIVIDLGSEQKILGLDIWGRQNHINGHIEEAKIYASTTPFTSFADHDAAKAYYDNEENVPVGTIEYTYDEATRDNVQSVRFDEVTARYILILTNKTSQNHLCVAEVQVLACFDSLTDLWDASLKGNLVTKANNLHALGTYIGKGDVPSIAMPDDVTEGNFNEKITATNAALQAYINSFDGQLIYIQHATRRGNAYLAAIPTGNGVKLNTLAQPTADAVWEIRFLSGNLGFYLYSRTTNMWITTVGNQPGTATGTASSLISKTNSAGHLAFINSSNGFNVDPWGNNLVWYDYNDDGSCWKATAITTNNQVYVEPEVSTADAPKYYRIVNARWMYNSAASNIAVNGENQDGNGNEEVVTRANASIPGIYWRIEQSGDGVKLINLTGYELTNPEAVEAVKMSDKGSTVYLIKQTDNAFGGVVTYAISKTATQSGTSCLDVSGSNSIFCWSPTAEGRGNGNNGSAWYFLAATDEEVANATATYINALKNRVFVADKSLVPLFGQGIFEGLNVYDGEVTVSSLNQAKVSGLYVNNAEKVAAVNAAVNANVPKLVDRHFLLHNCNSNYSNCYMTVANDATAPTADASDVNALWSFVPNGNGYLLVSAATGNSLYYTDTQSAPIPVVKDGLPYSIAYNANIPGFYFTLVPTANNTNVSYYSVHQSNNTNVCKWIANDIAGSHWRIETISDAVIRVEKDGDIHSIALPEGVTLNTHESAVDHVLTITKQLSEEEEEEALMATFSLEPTNGVHTVSASDFTDNKVELSGVVPGTYKVEAPAGMFLVNGKPSAAINDTFTVANDGTTTGVTEVGDVNAAKVVYDLQGRRVRGNAKGLLIVNGKKTVVK